MRKHNLILIAAAAVLAAGCQSETDAMHVACNPPPTCSIAEHDEKAYLACVREHISNSDVLAGIETVLTKASAQNRHHMLRDLAKSVGVTECPAAEHVFQTMDRPTAIKLLCSDGMKCLSAGRDYNACIDEMFHENAEVREDMKRDLDGRLEAFKRARREFKLLGQPFPPCPIHEKWESEAQP